MVEADFFGKIETVDAQRDSEWLRAGRYLAYIRKFFARNLRDGGGKMAGFELVILKVVDPTNAAQDAGGPHHAGDRTTWGFMLRQDAAWPAMKTAIASIMGVKPEEVTSEVCLECARDDQPLAGLVVELEGKIIITKKNERPFNRITVKRVVPASEVLEAVEENSLKSFHIDVAALKAEAAGK